MTFVHRCKWNVPTGRCFNCILTLTTGADPRFQVKRGVLKKIAPSGGGHENFWGISCKKITILCQKIIFFPILGGACTGCAPLDHGSIIDGTRTKSVKCTWNEAAELSSICQIWKDADLHSLCFLSSNQWMSQSAMNGD
jgi:hypothetical protein